MNKKYREIYPALFVVLLMSGLIFFGNEVFTFNCIGSAVILIFLFIVLHRYLFVLELLTRHAHLRGVYKAKSLFRDKKVIYVLSWMRAFIKVLWALLFLMAGIVTAGFYDKFIYLTGLIISFVMLYIMRHINVLLSTKKLVRGVYIVKVAILFSAIVFSFVNVVIDYYFEPLPFYVVNHSLLEVAQSVSENIEHGGCIISSWIISIINFMDVLPIWMYAYIKEYFAGEELSLTLWLLLNFFKSFFVYVSLLYLSVSIYVRFYPSNKGQDTSSFHFHVNKGFNLVLISFVTVLLVFMLYGKIVNHFKAYYHLSRNVFTNNTSLNPPEDGEKAVSKHKIPTIAEIVENVLREDLKGITPLHIVSSPRFKKEVDALTDNLFLPLYDNIPKVADNLYSVTGQYRAIYHYAKGDLGDYYTNILFQGFEKGMPAYTEGILGAFRKVYVEEAEQVIEKVTKHVGEYYEVNRDVKNKIMNLSRKMIMETLRKNQDIFKVAVSEVVAASSGLIAAKMIIKKSLVKKMTTLLVKSLAKKGVIKAASAAGTGAAAGTVAAPGVGTAVGIVGGLITYLATDVAMTAADEYFTRKEFEQALRKIITQEKEAFKQKMLDAFGKQLSVTPSQL